MVDYGLNSPWFPDPVKCFSEILSTGSQEIVNRLPWNGWSTWLRETWNTHYICFYFPLVDVYCFIGLAILLTLVRLILNYTLIKRIPVWYKMAPRDAVKFPASVWKVLIYSILWFWALSIIHKENYFFRLNGLWEGFTPGKPMSPSMYWLYMTELALYIHSIYATLYLEAAQKDFVVLMIHHFVTIALIGYSHAIRFHSIGLVVLFLHDFGDIWLETSKAIIYFKYKDGKRKLWPEVIANCTFAVFVLQWILFRMYWFATKAIYSASVISMLYYPNGPFYLPFFLLLCSLYVMHCYWFWFILLLVYKVVTGNEIKDNRDIDDESTDSKKKN